MDLYVLLGVCFLVFFASPPALHSDPRKIQNAWCPESLTLHFFLSGDLLEACWALQAVASCVITALPAVYEAVALAVQAAVSWEGRDPWKKGKKKSNKFKVQLTNIQDSKLDIHLLSHHDAISLPVITLSLKCWWLKWRKVSNLLP